jgi:hypothetical protein
MKPAKTNLLLHPLFLAALFVLLANDHYWKYEYGNWLTGKLSDFAGLVVLPIFLLAFFPTRRTAVVIGSGLFFMWWKSPLPEPFIVWMNEGWGLPVQRVIDWWDLLALSVLPVSFYIKPFTWKLKPVMKMTFNWMVAVVAMASLCATTMAPRYLQRAENPITVDKAFRSRASAVGVEEKFRNKGIEIMRDTGSYVRVYTRPLYIKDTGSTGTVMRPVAEPGTPFYEFEKPRVKEAYMVPKLVVRGDTLERVHFYVYQKSIYIESFVIHPLPSEHDYKARDKLRDKYAKPLRKRLKEILK